MTTEILIGVIGIALFMYICVNMLQSDVETIKKKANKKKKKNNY